LGDNSLLHYNVKITPSTTQAPTITPSTINLDLGTISLGSSGTKNDLNHC